MYSLTRSPVFCSVCSSSIIDRWTTNLDAGGGGPIWAQSDADCASLSETFAAVALIALALVLPLVLSIEKKVRMSPAIPNKTAETPADELPFPGKLVDGKYDVQYLHL